MTLYRQLALTIIVVFITGFISTVAISTGNLRHFLAEQLLTHAQDTATSLGLSLSGPIQDEDVPVMNAMIDAVFDRGFYQSITVVRNNGDELIKRQGSTQIPGVPDWFVHYIRLEAPAANAPVMAGWKPAATVRVTSHTGHAYRELWDNTIDTFRLYLLAMLAVLLLGLVTVRHLLKPLRSVALQAGEICKGNYPVQKELPRSEELRSVVKAMNRLALQVKKTFAEQASVIEKYSQQAFRDDLTGLGNRRYFEHQLRKNLLTHEESSPGELILLELKHLDLINKSSGFQSGDRLLSRTGELISRHTSISADLLVARISGAGFGIIAPGMSRVEAERLAELLGQELLQLQDERLVDHGDIAALGITGWAPGDTLSGVLSRADMAVRYARSIGDNTWFRYETPDNQANPHDSGEWRRFLCDTVKAGQVALFAQPVFGSGNEHDGLLQQEIFLRIRGPNGDHMTAGEFMPMAEFTGLAADLDRVAINMLLGHIRENALTGHSYAVNLASSSLHNPEFRQWLFNVLAVNSDFAPRLAFELPESGILRNIPSARLFIEQLKGYNCLCGIDHFGHGFHSFGYLSGIGVSYLKIDRGYIHDLDKDSDNRFLVKALIDVAHSIELRVIAGGVETAEERAALETLRIDGMQGYLFARPALLQDGKPGAAVNAESEDQADEPAEKLELSGASQKS